MYLLGVEKVVLVPLRVVPGWGGEGEGRWCSHIKRMGVLDVPFRG